MIIVRTRLTRERNFNFYVLFNLMVTVIHAWTKSNEKDSFECATQILNKIENLYRSGARPDLKPDVFSYSMLISALASKPSRSSARNAQDILDRMMSLEESHADGETTALDSGVLNAVMHVQSKSGEVGSAAKSENMLNRILEGEGPVRVRPVCARYVKKHVDFI